MPFQPEDFPIFTAPDKNILQRQIEKISANLCNFTAKTGIGNITVHDYVLYEIIERVEKRRVYFHIFYNGCKMGELNEAALLCFWILKLTPFFSASIAASALNAKIAIFIFINVLTYTAAGTGKKLNLSKQIISDLYYTFCYRDISKEAIMILAETLIS